MTVRNPATDRPIVLLGCGATLSRVARAARADGRRVLATTRDVSKLDALAGIGVEVHALDVADPASIAAFAAHVPAGSVAAHSVPVLRTEDGRTDPTPVLLAPLADRLARLVYLSSTGVYGRQRDVDERTVPAPVTPLQHLRVEAERACRGAVANTLVLRPAAIYGPGRGLHVLMREGRYRIPGDGSNYVSRIHLEDLAALVRAGLDADRVGAWPAADEGAATSTTIARFTADLLGLPEPPRAPIDEVPETLRFSRRVDARATFAALGVSLRYPTYREGFPAAIAAEPGSPPR